MSEPVDWCAEDALAWKERARQLREGDDASP